MASCPKCGAPEGVRHKESCSLMYERKFKHHCEKHKVSYDEQCGMCVDKEKGEEQNLNALISNVLCSQAVMMSIVAQLMLKVRNLEYAVKERQQQENHFGEHKDGASGGQASEAGSSDSPEQGEKETEKEVKAYVFRVSYVGGTRTITANDEEGLKNILLHTFGIDDYIILDRQ